MVKESIKKYFEPYLITWEQFNGTLPLTASTDKEGGLLYIGERNKEGYVSWKPILKKALTAFDSIEEKFNLILNESIKQYFNSYYFFQLAGWIEQYNINLDAAIPSSELTNLLDKISDYQHNGEIEYIPIGLEANGLTVVVHNITGKVFLEEYERRVLPQDRQERKI
ncbi:SecY-interacting protein Syd [Paenibacillus sp. NPDC057886]|uniref:SecY-interacting protein Syd n=1 Tax=Paenibacillus sp. NPDC057886 TaxID=3346270 RepID=UPI0036A83990